MDPTAHGPLSFGPELRSYRLAAQLSLAGLAKRVHYSRSHLSKVENGVKKPTPMLARQCDIMLRTDGALYRLLPDGPPAPGDPSDEPGDAGHLQPESPLLDDMWLIGLMSNGASTFTSVRRQSFGDALGAVHGRAIAPTSLTGWVDPTAALTYRTSFDILRDRGQVVGPADLIPTLISELHSVSALARRAGPDSRAGLYRLAARFAEYLGWMAQEYGRADWTVSFTDQATELARRGGDDMAAFRLVRLADLALYQGDAAGIIALAGQALMSTQDCRVRGLAAQRLAQGHALANERHACLRSLELARTLLGTQTPADFPVIGSRSVIDLVAMATGWCLFDLGQHKEAAEILAVEVQRLPATAHRSRARYGTRLARCFADMGEVDQACATAEPILRRLPSLASATVGVEVTGLATTLRRYHTSNCVRALLPLFAENRTTPPR